MVNILNKDLKFKLSCFKKLTQMKMFRNMEMNIGTLNREKV